MSIPIIEPRGELVERRIEEIQPIPQGWIDEVLSMDAPEADLVAVANGDFSRLSFPILVACHDDEQFQEFLWQNGLMCSEVRLLRHGRNGVAELKSLPADKVILLLPEWQADPRTQQAVQQWIYQLDRYTCQLASPRPLQQRQRNLVMRLLYAVLWGTIGAAIWLYFLF